MRIRPGREVTVDPNRGGDPGNFALEIGDALACTADRARGKYGAKRVQAAGRPRRRAGDDSETHGAVRRELHLPLEGDTRHQRHWFRVRRRGDGGGEDADGEKLAKHDPDRGYPSPGMDRVGRTFALAALMLVCYGPAAAAAPSAHVPILEFHVIGDPPAAAPHPELYDAPSTFRAQIAWLALRGYHAVTLDSLYRSWRTAGWLALPRRPIVLSFDDGYPQDVSVALPVLLARRWPGVLNLQIGNLVPSRVRQLLDAGWEVDAHTFTHPDLTRVDAAQLRREIAGSRKWIQSVFGAPANFFCYPFGRYDKAVVAAVRRAGYVGAETQTPGDASPADGMYLLHRIEVTRSDGVSGLAAKLAG
jgi:peptidoglycan/xylan/chitin deacetylase (PgdA/CDA1 family)